MLDLNAHYMVTGHGGIAWYISGYRTYRDEDYEWTGIEEIDYSMVNMIMVGDDRVFTFDVDDLTEIAEDAYCHECGQIGCTANDT